MDLLYRIINPDLLVRRVNITAARLISEDEVESEPSFEQLDLFTDFTAVQEQREQEKAALERERRMQEAMLKIKGKFGKNAIVKGMNLQEGATTMERNRQIGGHKA